MPSFDLLTAKAQDLAVRVAGLRFNYPQTLQGEAPALTLESIHSEPDPLVRDLDILLKKFDIFGALGHVDSGVSRTATPSTYRRMKNLDNALRNPHLTTAQERNNAFLDAEIAYFLGPIQLQALQEQELNELRTLARLECHLRIENTQDFLQLMEDFARQPGVVSELLLTELSRVHRATLASYSPDLVRTITRLRGGVFALKFLAHILQEAHIADRQARQDGLAGIVTVQLDDMMRAMHSGEFDPTQSSIRFEPHGNALIAKPRIPSLENLQRLPEFADAEALGGKRIILVGEGGGSDGVQAATVGKLLSRKYDCEVMAAVSVRNEERVATNTGRKIGAATSEITPGTVAVGEWRFLEGIPLEGEEPAPMYILNSTNPEVIKSDITALLQTTGAEVIIGVDTGGDSLYRGLHPNFSAHLPTDITPDQGYIVLQSLAEVAAQQQAVKAFSVIVAPGVDSPDYAYEILEETKAAQLLLDDQDVSFICRMYAQWRMDGSGSKEGRYGKTPLAWLHALQGRTGLQLLDLPRANVLSVTNPWRAFTTITPAMAGIVIMDIQRHFSAIERT